MNDSDPFQRARATALRLISYRPRSEAEVRAWCFRHGIVIGDVRPIETVARFAADWYARHLDKDWQKWTVAEARELIERHGLDGPIWELPQGDDARF